MSYWNHRLLATNDDEGLFLQVHEVYYTDEGTPTGYGEKSVSIESETIKGIKWQVNRIKECLKKPILWAGDKFPLEYKVNE